MALEMCSVVDQWGLPRWRQVTSILAGKMCPVLRFNELARDNDRSVSEYVIIGTLASFAWGLGAAFLARTVLAALGP